MARLTDIHFKILFAIADGKVKTQKDIHDKFSVSKKKCHYLVKQLIRYKLIYGVRTGTKKLLFLTNEGKYLVDFVRVYKGNLPKKTTVIVMV